MTGLTKRYSIIPDIPKLASSLRAQDLEEIRKLGSCPRAALTQGYLQGPCYTGLFNKEIICMYGVVPHQDAARIWMLSSNKLYDHLVGVNRITRTELNRFKSMYSCLYNIVDADNSVTIRWLEWMGFTVGKSINYGPEGHLFKEFCLWRGNLP